MMYNKAAALILALSIFAACPWSGHGGTAGFAHSTKATADPAEQNIKQGLLMIRKGDYDAAIDSFKQAVYFSRNQYNPEALKYLSLCYKATRNYNKALEAGKTFFSQTTEPSCEMHVELAECYMALGDFENARKEVQKAGADANSGAESWRYKFAMGELEEHMVDAGKEGSYGEAEQFYDNVLYEKPHETSAWMAKGRVELKKKDYNAALKTYREILSKGPLLHPNLEELYYNMGNCLVNRGDHQGALDHWRLCLEQNPDSFDAHLALGHLLDQERHYGSASKEYRDAVRCAPKDWAGTQRLLERVQWIEQQLQPKDAPIEIRPSPQMRNPVEEQQPPKVESPDRGMPSKDAGF